MLTRVEAATTWRGSSDTGRRRLVWWILVSLLLHSPFTPLAALFGLVALFRPTDSETEEPVDPITAIPIDLLEDMGPAGGGPPKPAEPAAAAPKEQDSFKDLAVDEPKPEPKPKPERTAEADEEADAGADAEAALASADGGADAGAAGTGSAIGDPVALSGAAGRIADANANVRLIVYTERIRNQPLGPRVGMLLSQAPQWRDFFGPAGLDPIKDVDRILIAGPQLRDSSQVVAVLKYNVSEGRMRQALDAIVQRDPANGGWLDAGVPAASARADRAERMFVMPTPGIVVVTPPSAAKSALGLGAKTKFPAPKGPEIMTAFVVTPSRAFRGLAFPVSPSIKWVRVQVLPGADGNATAELVAEDESEESAKTNAEETQRTLEAMTQLKLGILGSFLGKKEHRLVERISFSSQGKMIYGSVVVTPRQLATLVEGAAQLAKDIAERNARRRQETQAPQAPQAPPSEPNLAPTPETPAPQGAGETGGQNVNARDQ
jgi:hypothetical protein